MYAVVTCYKCGKLALAQTRQKTKQCPHCGIRFSVEKSKKLAYAKSAREASMLIRRLKTSLKEKEKSTFK
jgi:DNA-directed RNA polymerase subunit RPC12/RpoP